MENKFYAIHQESLFLFPSEENGIAWQQFEIGETRPRPKKIPTEKVAERHCVKARHKANVLRQQVAHFAKIDLIETALRRSGDYLRARARVHDAFIEQEVAKMIGRYDFENKICIRARLEDTDAVRKYLFFSRRCREDANREPRRIEILKGAAPEIFK